VSKLPQDTRITAPLPQAATPVAILSALTLLAGASGMAVSFLFLASQHHLNVLAGGAGFVAGAVLVAAGLLSLVVQSRSPTQSEAAIHVAGSLLMLLPPLAAALAWPVLYFGAFLAGILLIPLVLLACVVWAWGISSSVATNLSALLGWPRVGILHGLVLFLQVMGILASWPIFVFLLRVLESMGYKVGWS
jgi:hypothetical protein